MLNVLADGFLTQEDFEILYNKCSGVLHARNPFRTDAATIDFGKPIIHWVNLIQKLLNMHYMRLVDDDDLWLVYMKYPDDGKVHVLKASPIHATS